MTVGAELTVNRRQLDALTADFLRDLPGRYAGMVSRLHRNFVFEAHLAILDRCKELGIPVPRGRPA